ncbi:MAG: ComEC/Rec2 family competence protein, partial [Desulfobulbus sp.]
PFLWHRRIWRLDTVIITHPHGDHYNGLPFLLDHFRPHRLIINGDDGEEPDYQQLLARAREHDIPLQRASAGLILGQDGQVCLRCLGMPGLRERHEWTTNDRSLVFSLRNRDHAFLFPADIGTTSEQVLLNSGADLHATVLLAPHHGSRGSASDNFINAVDPALIVVSAGRNRQGILPAPEHLKRWEQQKIYPLVTAQDGTVTLESDGECLRARTFSGKELFWHRKTEEFRQEKCGLKGGMNRAMLKNY